MIFFPQKYDFLVRLPFRAAYSAAIIAPTVGILALYTAFHLLLWCGRDTTKSSVRWTDSSTAIGFP